MWSGSAEAYVRQPATFGPVMPPGREKWHLASSTPLASASILRRELNPCIALPSGDSRRPHDGQRELMGGTVFSIWTQRGSVRRRSLPRCGPWCPPLLDCCAEASTPQRCDIYLQHMEAIHGPSLHHGAVLSSPHVLLLRCCCSTSSVVRSYTTETKSFYTFPESSRSPQTALFKFHAGYAPPLKTTARFVPPATVHSDSLASRAPSNPRVADDTASGREYRVHERRGARPPPPPPL